MHQSVATRADDAEPDGEATSTSDASLEKLTAKPAAAGDSTEDAIAPSRGCDLHAPSATRASQNPPETSRDGTTLMGGMKRLQRLTAWLSNPPLTAPSSTLLLRLMVGGVFLSEGILKFTYVNQGVGRFTKIGIPFPQQTATFIGVLEIVGGLMLIAGLFTRRDLVAGRSPPAPSPAPSC